MSQTHRNLGRGLGDLIGEVSQVRAVPTRAPAPSPPPPPSPVPPARDPVRGADRTRMMRIALIASLALCAVLGILLYRRPPPEVVVRTVEVQAPAPAPAPQPAPVLTPTPVMQPARDTRAAWALAAGIPGIRVETAGLATRWIPEEPIFRSRDQLADQATVLLRQVAAAFQAHAADCVLVVVGHTDNDPPRAGSPYRDNVALGMLRALAAAEALREAGVPAPALRAMSMGEIDPPYTNQDPALRVKNRTVTFRIEPRI